MIQEEIRSRGQDRLRSDGDAAPSAKLKRPCDGSGLRFQVSEWRVGSGFKSGLPLVFWIPSRVGTFLTRSLISLELLEQVVQGSRSSTPTAVLRI